MNLAKKKAYEVLLDDLRLLRYQVDAAVELNALQLARHEAALRQAAGSDAARRFAGRLEESVFRLKEKRMVLGANQDALARTISAYSAGRDALVETLKPGSTGRR
jgi:hypothetical protein